MNRLILVSAVLISSLFLFQFQLNAQDTLRNKKGGGYVFTLKKDIEATAVQNQNRTGTCWSFSTTSFLEAEIIRLTGKKMTDKVYIRHTGYPGGQRFATPREVLVKNPRGVVEAAVKGMLPKNRLGRALFNNLFVYAGPEHPHAAQQPKVLTF